MLSLRDKSALLLAMLLLASACGSPPDDDDSAADDDDSTAGDDDDSTPPPDPLAGVIGMFNLTNVVQDEDVSYVDFSGGFGTFVDLPDEVLSPAAYLGTFSYGADAPYWRIDLGAYPLPAEGESEVVDMWIWFPWTPSEQTWWDGGNRIGAGNYLTSRLDLVDVMAYQVDDPVSPGAAGWAAGSSLRWENPGGEDVVAWSSEDIQLPEPMVLLEPAPGSELAVPAALELIVRWEPGMDAGFVTVGLINDLGTAYIAHAVDNGEHVIPASILSEEFGEGEVELVVARNLQANLEHPQGDIILRSREERRATLQLLPDIVIDPAFGEPGQVLTTQLGWFTQDLSGGVDLDFGEGITVGSVTPDPSDPHRVTVQLAIAADAPIGGRDVVLTSPDGQSETLPSGFAVLDLLPSDDCESAAALPPLEAGTYSSTTAGLSNDLGSGYSCLSWSLNGADAVYRVSLEAGETLVAILDKPAPADGALALLASCGDAASAVACADNGYTGDPETLAWTAESDGDYYLVVDAWTSGGSGSGSSAYTLELSIEQDVLSPDWIVPGTSQYFVLQGPEPWEAGILAADLDLGSGLGVDAVTVGSAPTDLEFLATAAAGAALGAHDIAVENGSSGTVSFPEALWVTGWPSYGSCSEATAAPAVSPGSTVGYALQTSSTLSDIPCMPYLSEGPEVILPIELAAGQQLSAAVTLPAEDAQLYVLSDCSLPETCFEDAAIDATLGGEEEALLDWLPPAPGRYYLVVDIWSGLSDPLTAWEFELSIQVD